MRDTGVPQTDRLSRLFSAARLAVRLGLAAAVAGLVGLLAPLLMGWQVYAVEGGSMEPSIPLGSLITVRPVAPADLAVGDVITFVDSAHRQARITHRVIEVETQDGRPLIHTKGDANTVADVWSVPTDAPIGRVAYFVPGDVWHYDLVVRNSGTLTFGYTLSIAAPTSSALDDPASVGQPASAGLQLSIARCTADFSACGTTVYDGPVRVAALPAGRLAPGTDDPLRVSLRLPSSSGAQFAGLRSVLDLVWTAQSAA